MKKIILLLSLILPSILVAQTQNYQVKITVKYLENNPKLSKDISIKLSKLFSEFDNAYKNSRELNLFGMGLTSDTRDIINALWKRHKFKLAGKECKLGVAKLYNKNEYAVFAIPMLLEGNDDLVEYCIQFNTAGTITNFGQAPFQTINFNVGSNPKRQVDEHTRGMLQGLLYELQMAYNTKDKEYVREIYNPNGYSIVGKKVCITRYVGGTEQRITLNNTSYNLTIKRLSDYVNDLTRVFDKNERINIKFGIPEINAPQNPNPEYDKIYYINVSQKYSSSRYNDFGWLTLGFDLRQTDKPQIFLRIWLPEKISNEDLTPLLHLKP